MPADLKPLPPRDAIAALFARGQRLEPSFAWQDAWQADHAAMFTVAKSAGFDILKDIHEGLLKALSQGTTFRDFARDLTPVLQAKGWWGRQPATDPVTGDTRFAQLGSTRRLRTNFDVNMRVSYAAGHWASFERSKVARPFLRYVAILDDATRPQHRARHNLVLPVDHPYWNVWAPPCGWNCRCTLQSLSQRDIDRLRAEGEELFFEPPADVMRSFVNSRTGEISTVPDGIDPGWAYNPGKAGFRALPAVDKLVTAPPRLAAQVNADPDWLMKAIGDEFATWFDLAAAGGRVERSAVAIGAVDQPVLDALAARGVIPASGAIAINQRAVLHILRDAKASRDAAVDRALLRQMPEILSRPRAVLRGHRDGELLYVFDVPGETRAGKLVVTLDFVTKAKDGIGKRATITTNMVRTAGLVDDRVLADKNSYEILSGIL